MRKIIYIFFFLLFLVIASPISAAAPVYFFDLEDHRPIIIWPTTNNATGYKLVLSDLDGNGEVETILGTPKGEIPRVIIYDADGKLLKDFLVYQENFLGGIGLAVGDIDGDGNKEIITSAGEGGGAHIRFFNFQGESLNKDFFAYDKSYNKGINIAALDVDGDGRSEIASVSGYGISPEIRIFTDQGTLVKKFKIKDLSGLFGFNISRVDLDGDNKDELVVAGTYGSRPEIIIYRSDGSLVDNFLVYNENFRGGVNLTAIDIDKDGAEEIITAAGITGGPHVKIFNAQGNMTDEFFASKASFDRGLNIGAADINGDGKIELATVAMAEKDRNITVAGRYIDVNVTKQKISWYDDGYKIEEKLTSTGKPSTPTRLGNFSVQSKYEVAYGGGDGQKWVMPKFVGFYSSKNLGNGFHALPYIDGKKEGLKSLGQAVSHGCVRMDDLTAQKFYQWVRLGDKITVHK